MHQNYLGEKQIVEPVGEYIADEHALWFYMKCIDKFRNSYIYICGFSILAFFAVYFIFGNENDEKTPLYLMVWALGFVVAFPVSLLIMRHYTKKNLAKKDMERPGFARFYHSWKKEKKKGNRVVDGWVAYLFPSFFFLGSIAYLVWQSLELFLLP